MRILAVIVSFGFFAFIIWFSYQQGYQEGSESTPPLITTDVNPTKVRPDKPGGMEIPDQDKLVYNRVDPSAQEPTVERLLPPPEKPLPRGHQGRNFRNPRFLKPGSFPIFRFRSFPGSCRPSLNPTRRHRHHPCSQAQKPRQLVPLPPAASQQQVVAPATGGYRVQIGAFRSEDAARTAWTRVQAQHKDLLATMTPSFQRADLGPKGIFFRLHAGPWRTNQMPRTSVPNWRNVKPVVLSSGLEWSFINEHLVSRRRDFRMRR
jgi:cell division septation protein DedD